MDIAALGVPGLWLGSDFGHVQLIPQAQRSQRKRTEARGHVLDSPPVSGRIDALWLVRRFVLRVSCFPHGGSPGCAPGGRKANSQNPPLPPSTAGVAQYAASTWLTVAAGKVGGVAKAALLKSK